MNILKSVFKATFDDHIIKVAVSLTMSATPLNTTRIQVRQATSIAVIIKRRDESNESLMDNDLAEPEQKPDTVRIGLGYIISKPYHKRCVVTRKGELKGPADLKAWYESTPHHHLTAAN